MTSNALLIHAEVDKIIAILLTDAGAGAGHFTGPTPDGPGGERGRRGAGPLALLRSRCGGPHSRARRCRFKAGEGELRDVAILTVDLRGFTRLSTELAPDEVMKVLQDYQHRINVVRNADSQIVDGNPNEVQKVVDLWTFRRDTTSGDPNWQLIKTESEG
ncbi:hypothetical protein OSTOST_12859 [Ostertagia ostertagi]